jgi:hypothetical protein
MSPIRFGMRCCILVFLLAGAALGQAVRVRTVPGQPGMVRLPYIVGDSQGNQWMIYQQGMLQMQGNNPVYSQGGMLTVNGVQPNVQTNMARLDDKTNELILENMNANGLIVTRRLEFNMTEGYVRYIDIIKNPQPQDVQVNLQISSNVNFGVQSAAMVPDPRRKDQIVAWVGELAGANKSAIEMYAGKGAKIAPTINWVPGNSVQAALVTTVPGNKEIAIVHVHGVAANQDQGVQWVNNLKESKLLADVPKEIRREIVNFPAVSNLIGDLEVLRGDALDEVELRDGDRFNGNLGETSYPLQTFYGKVDLPADSVVSILNAGQFRPRQLVVTTDGQIFGGYLIKPTIDLVLSSGQKTQIPLSQISRVGYRHRAGENEEGADAQLLQPPYVLMNSGDRIGVTMPTAAIAVVTRYGAMQLWPEMISSIAFSSEDSSVHVIDLTDGSSFNALVTAPEFEMKLTAAAQNQTVKFPVGSMRRLILKNPSDDKDVSAPDLKLTGEDHLVGSLTGTLQLNTAFDTMNLNAAEIRELVHVKDSPVDLIVTTWDGTTLSGQLQDQQVLCHLACGLDVHVPIDLVRSYANPSAQPSAMMMDRIKAIVADLNADDWKQRDAAEEQLVKLGPGVGGTLKAMRDQQPPEAQQRIDSVLKKLGKPSASAAGATSIWETNQVPDN